MPGAAWGPGSRNHLSDAARRGHWNIADSEAFSLRRRMDREWVMPGLRSAFLSLLLIAIATPSSARDGNSGMASFYPGIRASGEFTAAHRSLPFGTRVRVTRIGSGKSIIVRINDRGPFIAGRIIDVSRTAAEELQIISAGVARVRLEIVQTAEPKHQKLNARAESAPQNQLARRKMKIHNASVRLHQRRAKDALSATPASSAPSCSGRLAPMPKRVETYSPCILASRT
jgi:rare lipoprotein A